MLYTAGMKLPVKLLLVPLSAGLVVLQNALGLFVADWLLFAGIAVLILADAFWGTFFAILRGEFDWHKVGDFIPRLIVNVVGIAALSFVAAIYFDRPGAGVALRYIRDFTGAVQSVYFVGRIMLKFGPEGRRLFGVLLDTIQRTDLYRNGRNGNGRGNENGK